jgi:hypothetical protein
VKLLALLAATVALAAALGAAAARAAASADECRGLLVCLPVPGPWVAVPARTEASPGQALYELRCPLPGYIVAGTDVRLSDREIDVSFRGETGSPVSPGVTTSRAVLFSGTFAGTRRVQTAFRPFIGCVPTSGGGGRDQTSVRRPAALRPTRPLERRVVTRRLQSGVSSRVVARCRKGERLVAGSHAVGFFTGNAPPGQSLLGAVEVVTRLQAGAVVATVTTAPSLPPALRVVAQVHAVCRKASL